MFPGVVMLDSMDTNHGEPTAPVKQLPKSRQTLGSCAGLVCTSHVQDAETNGWSLSLMRSIGMTYHDPGARPLPTTSVRSVAAARHRSSSCARCIALRLSARVDSKFQCNLHIFLELYCREVISRLTLENVIGVTVDILRKHFFPKQLLS